MEFLFLLSRTRPQRRGGHHRNRLQKKRDVRPEGFRRTSARNHLVVKPCGKVAPYHRRARGEQDPEPPCSSLVAKPPPQHHHNAPTPQSSTPPLRQHSQ